MAERWQTHSGGQPQQRLLGLWSLLTMLRCRTRLLRIGLYRCRSARRELPTDVEDQKGEGLADLTL